MKNDEILKAIELYNNKMILRDIAYLLGYHHKTISKYLKKSGIKIINKGSKGQKKRIIKPTNWSNIAERDKLIIEQYSQNIGSPTIAKNLGISKKTVLNILKKNNIKTNKTYSKKKPPKQLIKKLYKQGLNVEQLAMKFDVPGYVISKLIGGDIRKPGETMWSLRGLEDKIRNLYNDGLSTYDIADILGFSHSESIRKFIKSEALTRSKDEIRKLTAIKLSNKNFQSRPEKQLESILQELNTNFSKQYPIDRWNFDFKVDNVLIEVQSYWHLLPGRIKKDQKKAKIAKDHGYKLFYIWEHQFKNPNYLKELLLYILKLKSPITFRFNDLQINRNKSDAVELMKWHYHQKIGRYGYEYVAYLKEVPIAACVFSSVLRKQTATKQKVNHDEILELSRLIIHPNYHKKNFGTWFLARCLSLLKKERPKLKKIVAFSDTTYNHNGGIYRASNWTYDGKIPSDYWYVTPTRSIKHKKTVWNSAKREKMTESQYCSKYKLQKVFGLPKLRFIKSL